MELTAANLATLEEGNSTPPLDSVVKTYLFRIGISKSTAYDYIYSDERKGRFINSDRIGPKQYVPNRLYSGPDGIFSYLIYYPDFPKGNPVRPVEFNAYWDQATWVRLVHDELVRIRKSAQEKRDKLQALVTKCPYKPWAEVACERMALIPQSVCKSVFVLPRIIAYPLVALFVVLYYSLVPTLLIIFIMPIASIKDLCCPPDFVTRAAWFEEVYKQNPDLDTFAIDNEVKRELDIIADKINTAYPQVIVDVGVGQDSHEWGSYDEGSVHHNRWTEHYDRFILQFQEAPKA